MLFSETYTPPPTTTAFFSLLSGNNSKYVDQMHFLSRSFRQFAPGQRLNVLVTDDVSGSIVNDLEKFSTVHITPPYAEPERELMFADRWVHQLTKFKLWSFYQYERICYLDADIAFFGRDTLPAIDSECANAHDAQLCAFEQGCDTGDTRENNQHWGMRYAQASFFCLRPSAPLFAQMERHLIRPFIRGNLQYAGRAVATEQDLMNLYFKDNIHYVDCRFKTSRNFVHGDTADAWMQWEVVNGQFVQY